MKKTTLSILIALIGCFGCSGKEESRREKTSEPLKTEKVTKATTYYDGSFDKEKTFIVISKKDLTLSVYAPTEDGDTLLLTSYPVCLSKNLGNKERPGDCRTPESPADKPFHIKQIQNSSTWVHDFKDGRGPIPSYGNWFLRLETPGHSGIGIHGSTNNENSVPGRESEGCIRLHDADIDHLKTTYAYVGQPVIIKSEDQGNLPFENHLSNPLPSK